MGDIEFLWIKFLADLLVDPKNPFADLAAKRNRYDSRWSNYFHNTFVTRCHSALNQEYIPRPPAKLSAFGVRDFGSIAELIPILICCLR
jgi:hypothetical protein